MFVARFFTNGSQQSRKNPTRRRRINLDRICLAKDKKIPMKKNSRLSAVFAAALFLAAAIAAQAQSPQKPVMPPAQPTPTQEQMERAVADAAKPGPIHAQLMKRAGTYTTKMTFSTPGSEPQESTGTATLKPILGGRFL